MDNIDRRHVAHLALIALLILIIVPGVAVFISSVADIGFFQVTNVIGAFGTILLSAILAYLYLQMWATQEERTSIHQSQEEILDKQVKIQEKQHKIIQTEKESLLDISNHSAENDDCHILLSNHGGGAIKELHIRTLISDGDGRYSGTWNSTQLRRIESGATRGGKVIGPKEKGIKIGCCPEFIIQLDGDRREGSFSEVSTDLVNNSIDQVRIRMHLIAVDEFGNQSLEKLTNDTANIHRNMPLGEVGIWKNS